MPRWQLPAAAILATATVVVPLAALPHRARRSRQAPASSPCATLLARVARRVRLRGLFVAAGLWFRRAVWWGLAFVLLWENVGATASEGTARFTVLGWARSIVSAQDGVDVPLDGRSATNAFVALPLSRSRAGSVATLRYRRADVD